MRRKDIEADGMRFVGGIKHDHVRNTLSWNDTKNPINQIAMRIKNGDALAIFNILADQIEQKRAFTRARRAYDVRMTHALFGCEAHWSGVASVNVVSEQEAA